MGESGWRRAGGSGKLGAGLEQGGVNFGAERGVTGDGGGLGEQVNANGFLVLEGVAAGEIIQGAEDGGVEFLRMEVAPIQQPREVLAGDFVTAKEVGDFGGIKGADEADVDVIRGGGDGGIEVGESLVSPAGLEEQKDKLGVDGAGATVKSADFGVVGVFGIEILEEGEGFVSGGLVAVAPEVAQDGAEVDAEVVILWIGGEGGFELDAGDFFCGVVSAEAFQGQFSCRGQARQQQSQAEGEGGGSAQRRRNHAIRDKALGAGCQCSLAGGLAPEAILSVNCDNRRGVRPANVFFALYFGYKRIDGG